MAIIPSPLLAALVAGPAGRLADRHGHRVVIVPGALLFAAGQLVYALGLTGTPSYAARLLPGLVLVGLGIGLAFPTLGSAGAAALPPARFGVGTAVVATARQVGAVLGVSVLVAILDGQTPASPLRAFRQAWWTIAATAVETAVVAGLLGRTVRREPRP